MTTPLPPGTVLGFDFGIRRIGVAVGNTITRKAQGLTTITAEGEERRWAAIAELLGEWQPRLLVVGIPVHGDGTAHAMTARAQRFARALAGRFSLPVEAADERYTTQLAQSALDAERAGRRGRARRDELAAQWILQGWFDERGADS
ncbi:MAG: Holliday junction resolvase RuvX [Burkholderiales bacterium]|nr:Holliday junction resolvase RuvX [Burkholderiales bacterium]